MSLSLDTQPSLMIWMTSHCNLLISHYLADDTTMIARVLPTFFPKSNNGDSETPPDRTQEDRHMKTSSRCYILAFTVLATSVFAPAKSPLDDSWLVLNEITHKRSYMIETRDRKCVWGTIAGVTADHVTAKVHIPGSSGSPDTVVFPRDEVLRVTSGRPAYYSGRSSWSDVRSLQVKGRERLRIVTTAGKSYQVKPPYAASDEGIALQILGKSTKVSKSEIAKVYHVVTKPLTDFGEYSLDELGPMIIFDPVWYVYGFHLEPYVSVLLYDASEPEDNSSLQCAPQ